MVSQAPRRQRTFTARPRPVATRAPGNLLFEWDIPALYEVARLEQRTDKLDDARRHYREFLESWGDADMPVPIVERAREQLAALGGN